MALGVLTFSGLQDSRTAVASSRSRKCQVLGGIVLTVVNNIGTNIYIMQQSAKLGVYSYGVLR